MKQQILLVLVLTSILSSCRSVDKYVRKGEYNNALDYAITKLQKKKQLKDKDVIALEEAFVRIRQKAEHNVHALYMSNHSRWKDIMRHIRQIDRAQKRIKSYMPIVSKNDYRASFSFINVGKLQEKALYESNNRDLTEIKLLVDQNDASDYYKVLNLYKRIQSRQEHVVANPSIIGVDGYKPSYTFAKIDERMTKVRRMAAKYEYGRAQAMLDIARKGDKKAARRAYELYHKVLDIDSHYKDTRQRIDEAHKLGTVHVLLKVINTSYAIIPREIESMIYESDLRNIGDKWTRMHTDGDDKEIDVIATINLLALEITPDTENVHIDPLKKEVKDGFVYVLDERGNVKKDSLGNDIKNDKYIDIHGEWATITRTKASIIAGKIIYEHSESKDRFYSEPIDVRYEFVDKSYGFKGDERLLTSTMRADLLKSPLPYPDNKSIVLDSGHILIEELKKELNTMAYNRRWYN